MSLSPVIMAVLPVLFSLLLILSTRRTMISLLLGALLGVFILPNQSLSGFFSVFGNIVWRELSNPWHYSALIFTVALGGFASLLQSSGGLGFFFHKVETKKQLELRVIGLGFLCFFDGLANSLLLGRLVRPVADRVGVSREKLAYLADTTSSSIACLAPVSTWIAMQLGLISVVLLERGIEISPYTIFLKSISLNFYCLFSLVLALLLSITGKDFGFMKKAKPVESLVEAKSIQETGLIKSLLAVGVLLLSIPILYYFFEEKVLLPVSLGKVINALGGGSGPKVFMISSILSLSVIFLLNYQIRVKERVTILFDGMRQMVMPLGVLLCAWLFGGVLQEHDLAGHLSDLLGDSLSVSFLPVAVFLLGCLLSFTTGTSWGTMALLFPIAFGFTSELTDGELLNLFPILVAAIFSGAVFGDHCSPYSDTTIVSSLAAGCSTYSHVNTQLPYALICGVLAALFFIIFGFILL